MRSREESSLWAREGSPRTPQVQQGAFSLLWTRPRSRPNKPSSYSIRTPPTKLCLSFLTCAEAEPAFAEVMCFAKPCVQQILLALPSRPPSPLLDARGRKTKVPSASWVQRWTPRLRRFAPAPPSRRFHVNSAPRPVGGAPAPRPCPMFSFSRLTERGAESPPPYGLFACGPLFSQLWLRSVFREW